MKMKRLKNYIKKWGFAGLGLYIKKKNIFSRYISFQLPEFKEPIYLRHNTSDVKTFDKIFLEDEYDFDPELSPELIIDAGANIGAASIYFALKYPDATIISLEPEKTNFNILKKNSKKYKNICCLNKALWYTKESLYIKNLEANKESFEVQSKGLSNETGFVEGISINELMVDFKINQIDILKIDIEGSEKEVFSHNTEWLKRVGLIFIEFHDRKKPGCRESFSSAIKNYVVQIDSKGETTIAMLKC